MTRRHYKVL